MKNFYVRALLIWTAVMTAACLALPWVLGFAIRYTEWVRAFFVG